MIFVWWLSQDNLTIYSYFGKGCRKKCTRQSRKVWCVVLSALFFKKICTNFLSLCLVFVLSPLKPIFWLENNYNVPVARCLYFSLLIVLHQLMYHYSTENSAKEQRIDISFQNRMSKIKKRLHANVGPIVWARQARLTEMTFSRTLTSNLPQETFFNSVDFGVLQKDSAWMKMFVEHALHVAWIQFRSLA